MIDTEFIDRYKAVHDKVIQNVRKYKGPTLNLTIKRKSHNIRNRIFAYLTQWDIRETI